MDMHCQDMDIQWMCRIRPAGIPHTINSLVTLSEDRIAVKFPAGQKPDDDDDLMVSPSKRGGKK